MSFGDFGGKIVAIENFGSVNGKYRVLISPDLMMVINGLVTTEYKN
jgi:hypothetical protein